MLPDATARLLDAMSSFARASIGTDAHEASEQQEASTINW